MSLGVSFEVSDVQARPSVVFSLSAACQSNCRTPYSAPCLPVYHHASFRDDSGLNLRTVSQAQLNAFTS